MLPVFCPFVGMFCVTRLLSAVISLNAHSLSLSFEEEKKIVKGSSLFSRRAGLAPHGGGLSGVSPFSASVRSGRESWCRVSSLCFLYI